MIDYRKKQNRDFFQMMKWAIKKTYNNNEQPSFSLFQMKMIVEDVVDELDKEGFF